MKMYKSVLDRVRILEEKNGIVYADTNGRLYKVAKVFFVLSFIYAMFIKLMYFLGAAMDTTSRVYETTTPAICTGVLILGFVLLLFKQHIIGFISMTVSAVMLMFVFNVQLQNGMEVMINHKFAWAHLIPLSLLIIFSFVMTVVAVRAKVKLKKMYNKVINDIYEKYSVNVAKGEEIDEAEWEEFIEKFNPFDYGNQFVKKVDKSEEENT